MRITVFGATGGTGRAVVEQALAAGHEVTALLRNPSSLQLEHESLHLVAGDALDPSSVERAIEKHDAVVSSLGTRPWRHTPICSQGTGTIVAAMQKTGVRRLVCVSSFGVGETRAHASWFLRGLMDLTIGRSLADKEVMESTVRASDLDWILVRPVGLTSGRARGVRAADDGSIRGGLVARADVAAFVLAQVTGNEWLRRAPVLATS